MHPDTDFFGLFTQALEPIFKDIGSLLNQMVDKYGIVGTLLILLVVKKIITK